ncbi:hypothetical protein D3C84_937570 [compost metagenome]
MYGVEFAAVFIGIEEGRRINLALAAAANQIGAGARGSDAFARLRGAPGRYFAVGFVPYEHQVAARAAAVLLVGNQRRVGRGDGVFLVPLHGRSHIEVGQRKTRKNREVRLCGGA